MFPLPSGINTGKVVNSIALVILPLMAAVVFSGLYTLILLSPAQVKSLTTAVASRHPLPPRDRFSLFTLVRAYNLTPPPQK